MRHVPSIIFLVLFTISATGCKSQADQKAEYEKNQNDTMQKMLNASIESDGGATPGTKAQHGDAGQ